MPKTYVRLLEAAQEALEEEEPARAVEALRGALRIRQAYAPLWTFLAEACDRAGEPEAAYQALCRAAFLEPGDGAVTAELGRRALALGRKDEAAAWSRKAAAAARSGLGSSLRRKVSSLFGRGAAAAAPPLPPDLPPAAAGLVQKADEAAGRRQFTRALELLTQALAAAPGAPAVLHRMARMHMALGSPAGAERHLRDALAAAPDDPALTLTLVELLARVRKAEEARARLGRLPEAERRSLAGRRAEAILALETGRAEEAAGLLSALAAEAPGDVEIAEALADAHATRGRFDEAGEWLAKAAALDPRRGQLYDAAALYGVLPPGSELFAMAEALTDDAGAPQRDRATAHFGLARACRAAGDRDAAFTHFEHGNALVDVLYDAAEWDETVDAIIAATRALDFARAADRRRGEGRVFMVGLPRSGSTLIEQIVDAHPRAYGAGENDVMPGLIRDLGEDAYPACLPALDEPALASLAADYLRQVPGPAPGSGDGVTVTDKSLLNFLHLGLIALMLPGATVLHCLRDPMDVGFSIFCQRFRQGHDYAYSQAGIAHFIRLHDRLMAHWRRVLPLRIHEVRYEAVVADPEAETRAILAAIGLPFDPACIAFHASGRDVRTSSIAQVRQPVHKGSVGAWKPHADRLAPLAEALAG